MKTITKGRKILSVFFPLLALNALGGGAALAQVPAATQNAQAELTEAEVDVKLRRLQELCQKNLRAEVVAEFKDEDMTAWLAAFKDKNVGTGKVKQALSLRGTSLIQKGEYELAKKDYTYALELSPSNGYAWSALGGIYQHEGDDDKALDAYNKAYEYDSAAHTGKSYGWMPIDATLKAVAILTMRADYAGALKTLERYNDDDIQQMGKAWGSKMLRAYGQVFLGTGREEEAMAKFKAALEKTSD